MKKTEKKRDFIQIIAMMDDTELNDYIKRNGHGPKPVNMCRIITKEEKDERAKARANV